MVILEVTNAKIDLSLSDVTSSLEVAGTSVLLDVASSSQELNVSSSKLQLDVESPSLELNVLSAAVELVVGGGWADKNHKHSATDLTSGTLSNPRVAEQNVTQHEAALTITESQISDLGDYEPANVNIQAHIADTSLHYLMSAISITESQISNLQAYLLDLASESISTLADVVFSVKSKDDLISWNGLNWVNIPGSTFSLSGHDHSGIYEPANANIQTHIADGTTHFTMAGISITESQISDLQSYELAFTKNTAFNKDFGTIAGTTAEGNHNHDAAYEPKNANIQLHIADSTLHFTQAQISITESQITDLGNYEPAFTKNTAFNKNFGTLAGEVCEGNDSRLSDARAPTAHTHTESEITDLGNYIPVSQKAAANGVATLGADSKIPTSQLPALAITDTSVVASQAAMLALTAETGDVAVRSDENKTYILKGGDPSILGDWQELLTPTDSVLSVNGFTGAVTLTTSDIAEGTNLYYTEGRVGTNTDVAANTTHRGVVTGNPHAVTQGEVGLGNVDNTSDADKPVSTAQQTEIDTKEDDLSNPGTDGHVLSSTIAGIRSWVENGLGKLANLIEDATPQLGGNLDCNGKFFTGNPTVKQTGNSIFKSIAYDAASDAAFQGVITYNSSSVPRSFFGAIPGDGGSYFCAYTWDTTLGTPAWNRVLGFDPDAKTLQCTAAGITYNTVELMTFAGGTFTGSIAGTTATFSGQVQSNGSFVLTDIVDDATPQLGGDLDLNGHNLKQGTATDGIVDVNGDELLSFDSSTTPTNYFKIKNSNTGSAPELTVDGPDANINLKITPKGSDTHLIVDKAMLGTWVDDVNQGGLFYNGGASNNYLCISAGGDTYISTPDGTSGEINLRPGNNDSSKALIVGKTRLEYAGNEVWHAGNDGASSGLDADKLDGSEASAFGKLAAAQTWTGVNTFSGNNTFSGSNTHSAANYFTAAWLRMIYAGSFVQYIVDKTASRNANPSIRFTTSAGVDSNGDYTKAGCLIDNVNSVADGYFRMARYNASSVQKSQMLLRENGKIEFTGNDTVPAESLKLNGLTVYNAGMEVGFANLSLVNSWVVYPGFSGARYRMAGNDVVHLEIMIKNGTLGTTVATLPAGFRPGGSIIHTGYGAGGVIRWGINTFGTISISTGGSASWSSLTCSFKAQF